MALLSIVLPAYNEEMMVERAGERLEELLKREKIDFELIFVDDGSMDATWFKIQEMAKRHPFIRGVHFSRNFEKRQRFLQAWRKPSVIAALLWTAICSIRRKRLSRCIADGKKGMKSLRV